MIAADRPLLVVLRALGLGDLLTGVAALRALGRTFPDHARVLLSPEALTPLALASGAVDTVIDTDFRREPPRPAALPALPARPDVAVNLHGRGPGSHRALLALEPRRLIAYGQPAASVDGPEWDAGEHEVDRWCRLLADNGIDADPTDLRLDVDPVPAPGAAGRPCVVIHPGASSPARQWPPARWAAVARAQRVLGRAVVVTGSSAERGLALAVATSAGLPPKHVLAGRTSLASLAGIVAGACLVVSGDTGPAHLATALGIPSVTLFGPVPPSRWGPRIDRRRHAALWRGWHGDPHAVRADPGLLEISVPDVLAAMRGVGAEEPVL